MTGKSFSGNKPPYFKRRDNQRTSKHRRNERIRVPQVRLIASDGRQIGVVPTEDALALAKKRAIRFSRNFSRCTSSGLQNS